MGRIAWAASRRAGERPESDYSEWVCETYADDAVRRCRAGVGVVPAVGGEGEGILGVLSERGRLDLGLGMCWVGLWRRRLENRCLVLLLMKGVGGG